MLKLFYWDGRRQCGCVWGELGYLIAVETALKKDGWKVIIMATTINDMQPYQGYEAAYKDWQDSEA